MNTLHFTINNKQEIQDYKVKFKNLSFDDGYISAEDVSVYKNGKKTTDLNESFAGHKYTPSDVLESVICAYINNDNTCNFVEIPTKIRNMKRKLDSPFMNLYKRDIPKYYRKDNLETANPYVVQMITDQIVVYSNMEDFIVCDTEKGSVITDIDAFATSAIVQSYKKDQIYYLTPMTCDWIKEYLKDDDEPNKEITIIMNKGGQIESVYVSSDLKGSDVEIIDFCTDDPNEIDAANDSYNYLLHQTENEEMIEIY